jgi:2',3'-cyclic-nucleotide 2'-phosphodiesterase (5'-nucleotidase family)
VTKAVRTLRLPAGLLLVALHGAFACAPAAVERPSTGSMQDPSSARSSSGPFSSDPVAARLVLVHLSDSEAGLLPDEASETGGLARAQAVVAALQQRAGPAGLVLGVGDLFIPSPELSLELDGKSAVLEGNKRLFLQASALGNHELDLGEQFLADAIAEMPFPYLTATVRVHGGPLAKVAAPIAGPTPWAQDVAGKLVPRVKLCAGEREGDRCRGLVVGVVGATTEELRLISAGASGALEVPADLAGVRDAVQAEVEALKREGIVVVVLLSHLQGARREAELIESGLVGVDVVLAGGGENKLASPKHRLAAADVPDRLCAEGPRSFGPPCYPTTLVARDGRPVLLAATGGELRYVGNLITSFDEHGVLTGYDERASRPWPVDEDSLLELRAQVDRDTLAFQQRTRRELEPLLEVVATSDVFLEGAREQVRNRETNFGDLSADAIQSAAVAAGKAPALTLRNGGGIRGPIGSIDAKTNEKSGGPIRVLDLKTALRFDSQIVVVETTHAGLKRTLESALRGAGSSKGHFPQVSSEVRLEYAVDAPEQTHVLEGGRIARLACPGARVRTLIVTSGASSVVVVKDGKLPTPHAKIRVATLDYLAKGGDGWFPGEAPPFVKVEGVTEQTSLRAFLAAEEKAGRWRGGKSYVDGVAARIVPLESGGVAPPELVEDCVQAGAVTGSR